MVCFVSAPVPGLLIYGILSSPCLVLRLGSRCVAMGLVFFLVARRWCHFEVFCGCLQFATLMRDWAGIFSACDRLWVAVARDVCFAMLRLSAASADHCADLSPDLVHNCAAAQLPPAFPEATPRPFSDAFQSMCAVAFVTDLGAIATGGPATAPHRKIELRHGPLTCGAGPIAFCFFGVYSFTPLASARMSSIRCCMAAMALLKLVVNSWEKIRI